MWVLSDQLLFTWKQKGPDLSTEINKDWDMDM